MDEPIKKPPRPLPKRPIGDSIAVAAIVVVFSFLILVPVSCLILMMTCAAPGVVKP